MCSERVKGVIYYFDVNSLNSSTLQYMCFGAAVDREHSMLSACYGPLTRYVILRVAHAPGIPGTFPRHRELAIPTCITARAWRTCRDVCRDRKLAVSFEVGGGENVPGLPGACAIRNFTYLVRGPCHINCITKIHSLRSDHNPADNVHVDDDDGPSDKDTWDINGYNNGDNDQ